MTEDDVEARLRTMLAAKAGQLEPGLTGPQLRSTARPAGRARRIAPALGAAAAVALVAVSTQLLGSHHAAPPREQPGQGGPSVSAPVRPTTPAAGSATPSPSPVSTPSRPRVGASRPSLPGTGSVSSAPVLLPTSATTRPTGAPPRPSTSGSAPASSSSAP